MPSPPPPQACIPSHTDRSFAFRPLSPLLPWSWVELSGDYDFKFWTSDIFRQRRELLDTYMATKPSTGGQAARRGLKQAFDCCAPAHHDRPMPRTSAQAPW